MLILPSFAGAQEAVVTPPADAPLATPDVTADKGAGVDILPAKTINGVPPDMPDNIATHPSLKLTPDKSELVRLDGEAGTVIVGNPLHLSVVADSSRTLVLVPRQPGATYVVVLDRQGNVLMQRHVLVASPQEKYVRIRKSCVNSKDDNCQTTQVYYCPDTCHEIGIAPADEAPKTDLDELMKAQQQPTSQGAEEGGSGGEGEETSEE
jgi:hypothetical protein